MHEGTPGNEARPRSARALDDRTSRSVRRRLWGAVALLFLAAVFGLASFGAQEAPRFRFEGLTPGAWQESTGGTGAPAIHFGTNPPCMFQGPRYAEVRAALASARSVTIECGEGMLGAIAIRVEVDGVPVLAQREASSFWSGDSRVARTATVVCAVAGLGLIAAALVPGLRRARRAGSPSR